MHAGHFLNHLDRHRPVWRSEKRHCQLEPIPTWCHDWRSLLSADDVKSQEYQLDPCQMSADDVKEHQLQLTAIVRYQIVVSWCHHNQTGWGRWWRRLYFLLHYLHHHHSGGVHNPIIWASSIKTPTAACSLNLVMRVRCAAEQDHPL